MGCTGRLLCTSSCVCLRVCMHVTKRPSHWEAALGVASPGQGPQHVPYDLLRKHGPLGEAAHGLSSGLSQRLL